MRVKLIDPKKDVKTFIFGRKYEIYFYGGAGSLQFTHTRKKHIFLQNVGKNNELISQTKLSKRELKKLLREDFVQWVIEKMEGNHEKAI